MQDKSDKSKVGFVKIHRSLFDNPLFTKYPEFIGPWVWIIAKARFKANGIGRGQLELSRRLLHKQFPYLSLAKCQRFFDQLIDQQMIRIDPQPGQKMSIVTVCNYETYQAFDAPADPQSDPQSPKIDPQSDPSSKNVSKNDKNGKEKSTRGTRLPADFKLPEDWKNWVLVNVPAFPADQINSQAEQFRDYWISQPGQKGVKLNWQATWRNWMRNARSVPAARQPKPRSSSILAERVRREQERANG